MAAGFYIACDYWCERCDHAADCPVCERTREDEPFSFTGTMGR
jgi:hypothetical protein